MRENRHSILVRCERGEALEEIIRWGEAPWWPKNCLMRFVRKNKGPIKEGTSYQQKVLLPFAPAWDVEVEHLTDQGITRRFLNGMFTGEETVSLERGEGESREVVDGELREEIKVNYVMNYQINGLFNRILWSLIFQKLHNKNIDTILSHLRDFLEKKDERRN